MAAAVAGIAAAKSVGAETAGVVRSVIQALEKPIYSDLKTEVVTWTSETGTVHTTTKTKGYTIPVGFALGVPALIMLWEAASALAQGLGKLENGIVAGVMDVSKWTTRVINVPNEIANAVAGLPTDIINAGSAAGSAVGSAIYNSATGITTEVVPVDASGQPSASTGNPPVANQVAIKVPPTAMAALSQLVIETTLPLLAAANGLGTQAAGRIQSYLGGGQ